MLLGRHGGWWEEKDRLGCPYLLASSDVGGGSVPDADADADADLARSILACPESAELAVDGHRRWAATTTWGSATTTACRRSRAGPARRSPRRAAGRAGRWSRCRAGWARCVGPTAR